MRGETMKDKSKKSTYSTTFGVDPIFFAASTGLGSGSCREILYAGVFVKIHIP